MGVDAKTKGARAKAAEAGSVPPCPPPIPERPKRETGVEAQDMADYALALMMQTETPIDSCILASELIADAAGRLGYEVDMQPMYVKVIAPHGETVYDLEQRLAYVPEENYAGHLVAILDKTWLVDVTALQFWSRLPTPPSHPTVVTTVPKDFFTAGSEVSFSGPSGTLVYKPFDDNGDWMQGRDDETRAGAAFVGSMIASKIEGLRPEPVPF